MRCAGLRPTGILDHRLPPTPATRPVGETELDVLEPAIHEPVEKPISELRLGDRADSPSTIQQDRLDPSVGRESTLLVVGCESSADELGKSSSRTDPDISISILGQLGEPGMGQVVRRLMGPEP